LITHSSELTTYTNLISYADNYPLIISHQLSFLERIRQPLPRENLLPDRDSDSPRVADAFDDDSSFVVVFVGVVVENDLGLVRSVAKNDFRLSVVENDFRPADSGFGWHLR
jgi:hypothetical protein